MANSLTPDLLWRLPRVGSPSAGGEVVCVPVTTYDLETNEGTTRIWQLDLEGDAHRPLTEAGSSATKPAISPTGDRLAFVRKHDGHTQVHVMPLDGGEAERVTDLPLGVHGCVWRPDGKGLVVVADLLAGHLTPEETAEERDRRERDPAVFHATESAVYRYWDTWLTDGKVPHLFSLDLDSKELVDLTPHSTRWMQWPNTADPVADVAIAPDGSEVAFCADDSAPPHRDLRWRLFTVDTRTLEENCLTPRLDGHTHRPRYTADGRYLVYGLQRQPEFYADRVRIVRRERPTGEEVVLTEGWDRSAGEWEVAADGTVVFCAEEEGRQPVWRLRLEEGSNPEVVAKGGTFSGPAITASGRVFATCASLLAPPEVVEVGDHSRQVTSFTRPLLQDVEIGEVTEMTVEGAEGEVVQVLLLRPPGAAEGRLPLVHMIHGGPHGVFGDTWHWRWNAGVFAAPGHLVAMVNFHGSTSWGETFARSIHGEWGAKPAADVEAATDALVEAGMADPERMAITGGSYGGYLVAWLTATTGRYRCAVAHAAVTDLPAMYASDITMGRRLAYGAEIFEDLERVNRWSPLAHSSGFSTPTLVIHGDRDYRVPVTQGLELYGVLKAKGVEARLVHYPEENHWILSPANSIHWYGEVLAWLARFLA